MRRKSSNTRGTETCVRIIISGHAKACRSYGLPATTVWSAKHAHRTPDPGVGVWPLRTVNFNRKRGFTSRRPRYTPKSSPFRVVEFPLDSRALIHPSSPCYYPLQFLVDQNSLPVIIRRENGWKHLWNVERKRVPCPYFCDEVLAIGVERCNFNDILPIYFRSLNNGERNYAIYNYPDIEIASMLQFLPPPPRTEEE